MESITRQLIELGAVKIILFGSLAEGNVDVYSDLDLFVIMPSTKSGDEIRLRKRGAWGQRRYYSL
jgi:predicted nucleotidyltransferase